MHTKPFSPFCAADQCSRRVEQIRVISSYECIRQWCLKFGACFADKLRRRRPRPGDKWHLDEVFVRIGGVLHYLWRAVDQTGSVLDILIKAAAMPEQRSASSSGC